MYCAIALTTGVNVKRKNNACEGLSIYNVKNIIFEFKLLEKGRL